MCGGDSDVRLFTLAGGSGECSMVSYCGWVVEGLEKTGRSSGFEGERRLGRCHLALGLLATMLYLR